MNGGSIRWSQTGSDDWVAQIHLQIEYHIHRRAEVYSAGSHFFATLQEAKEFWQKEYNGQLIRWLYE